MATPNRKTGSFAPPNSPWIDLAPEEASGGYLSFYYSDDKISPIAVRAVTKIGDNKSDPNIETMTYGMFSTCSPSMRNGIVKRHCTHIFFTTSWKGERVLTGYYTPRWYAPGKAENDFLLAADLAYFVEQPLSLKAIDKEYRTSFSKKIRGARLLSPDDCKLLAKYIHKQRNKVDRYLAEIERLENRNLLLTGYRYAGGWQRKEKFSWETCEKYLLVKQTGAKRMNNSSPTGFWECSRCGIRIKNKARLRKCPSCGKLDSLGVAL